MGYKGKTPTRGGGGGGFGSRNGGNRGDGRGRAGVVVLGNFYYKKYIRTFIQGVFPMEGMDSQDVPSMGRTSS